MAQKIFLIEDDAMLREMYETKLKAEGYELKTAEDGGEGLRIAQTEQFDLILLDIMLPLLDGFSILEELKAKPETAKTPVVMLTNLGTDEDRAKGEKLGAVDYLVKANMTPEQLVTAIKKYL